MGTNHQQLYKTYFSNFHPQFELEQVFTVQMDHSTLMLILQILLLY